MMAGCCGAEACTDAVLIGVMHLPACRFDIAWCLVSEVCRLMVDWVDCRCFLSFVFVGGARRLELSPCHTWPDLQVRLRTQWSAARVEGSDAVGARPLTVGEMAWHMS